MNKEQGITLIVLVVTIVILIILAGVTLGSLVNMDIINLAKDSANKTNSQVNKTLTEIDEMRKELEGFGVENSDGGGDENGDGIPDKYQAVVTFEVVNGTWTGSGTTRKKVVNLRNQTGELDENGSYTLTSADIPTGIANAGYNGGSTWTSNPPLGTVIMKPGATFTLTYSAPAIPDPPPPTPIIPDPPTPIIPD